MRFIGIHKITSVSLRQGRDRAGRFVSATPLREIVITTQKKTLVLSSIPLGNEAMSAVIETLKEVLPADTLSSELRSDQ